MYFEEEHFWTCPLHSSLCCNVCSLVTMNFQPPRCPVPVNGSILPWIRTHTWFWSGVLGIYYYLSNFYSHLSENFNFRTVIFFKSSFSLWTSNNKTRISYNFAFLSFPSIMKTPLFSIFVWQMTSNNDKKCNHSDIKLWI